MSISTLWLSDFRCFEEACVEPDPGGLTVLRGMNGSGKTSVLEAIAWLATGRSFRGAARETLVRTGSDRAIVRAEATRSGVQDLIEAEIPLSRAGRVLVNRQPVRRRSEMAEVLQVSVFSPADRRLVEGGPSERRGYLDEVLEERHPRLEALVGEVEQILRQRTALLRQAGGRSDQGVLSTLDVWDDRLGLCGTELSSQREALALELQPFVARAYERLAGHYQSVELRYRRSWAGDLHDALAASREEDLRRQVTTLGPHRDELDVRLASRSTRTHASQGEQRCMALAMRLASHDLRRAEACEPPVLLLDDVFSELDHLRAAALVELLPKGQVLLTTAVDPPPVVGEHQVVEVCDGSFGPLSLFAGGTSRRPDETTPRR